MVGMNLVAHTEHLGYKVLEARLAVVRMDLAHRNLEEVVGNGTALEGVEHHIVLVVGVHHIVLAADIGLVEEEGSRIPGDIAVAVAVAVVAHSQLEEPHKAGVAAMVCIVD